MQRSCLLVLLFLFTMMRAAQADGVIFQLPQDGTQVLYDTETAITINGESKKITGSLTVSSVGKTMEDGEECRWIELKTVNRNDNQDEIEIMKVLVPEKYLKKGEAPAEHIIRAWKKTKDEEPKQITDFQGFEALAIRAFLSGPPKTATELKKVEVDGKLGKLECGGVAGEIEFDVAGQQAQLSVENRLHEKSPFGLVNGHWKFELKQGGQAIVSGMYQLTFNESTTTALSQLPDKK